MRACVQDHVQVDRGDGRGIECTRACVRSSQRVFQTCPPPSCIPRHQFAELPWLCRAGNIGDILRTCDEFRDTTLPMLGVEVRDARDGACEWNVSSRPPVPCSLLASI